MSDAVEITKVLAPVLSVAISAYIGLKMAQLNQKQGKAAEKTEEVAETLKASTAATTADLKEVKADVKATRVLVNHDRGVLLLACATALRRVAKLPDHNDDDIMAATLAEQAYEAHMTAQAVVDKQPGTA